MAWIRFIHSWPFVGRIHQTPVDIPHKGRWWGAVKFSSLSGCTSTVEHNVEIPSMDIPNLDMAKGWSSCIFDTFCFAVVDSGWPAFWDNLCFTWRLTYVYFVAVRLPDFAMGPRWQYQHISLIFKIYFEARTQTKSTKKIASSCKTWMGFVPQILINWETSCILLFSIIPLMLPGE